MGALCALWRWHAHANALHTGQVHFLTLKGRWNYEEYPDDPQTEGSYLFEPPGTVHTLHIPDDVESVEGFMVVNGVNVNFR